MKSRFFCLLILMVQFAFSQCPGNVGVYYWGGQINGVDTSVIIPTAKKLADSLGVNTIRIALVSNDDNVYKNTGTCLTGKNLTWLASRPDFNAIITDPQFSTVIITAYDWASFGDCNTQNFIDTNFYTPSNIAAISQEFTDLANYLKQFTSKTFIITNWEGDNAVYGGAAYSNPNYPQAPANIVGFKKWMMARSAGVAAANAANVKYGIEFCNVHSLENLGKPSILNNVIPFVNADFYLYSAYESFNVSSNQLASDIDYIRTKLTGFGKNPNALLIGEMGFGKSSWGGSLPAADSLQKTINVVLQKNIPYSIAWVLIDTPSNFGMYDDNGIITPSGTVLKSSVCNTTNIVNKDERDMDLKIFPNPSDKEFTYSFTTYGAEDVSIEFASAIGQVFLKKDFKGYNGHYESKMNCDILPAGIYFFTIKMGSVTETRKVIFRN